jgi:hypothetical protein
MSGVVFLLYLCATASAPLFIVIGLSLFAVPKFRGFAPYVALVYPAMYCGGFVGIAAVLLLNALVKTSGHWWQEIITLAFLTGLVGGACVGGFLGYKLANRIAERFQETG